MIVYRIIFEIYQLLQNDAELMFISKQKLKEVRMQRHSAVRKFIEDESRIARLRM